MTRRRRALGDHAAGCICRDPSPTRGQVTRQPSRRCCLIGQQRGAHLPRTTTYQNPSKASPSLKKGTADNVHFQARIEALFAGLSLRQRVDPAAAEVAGRAAPRRARAVGSARQVLGNRSSPPLSASRNAARAAATLTPPSTSNPGRSSNMASQRPCISGSGPALRGRVGSAGTHNLEAEGHRRPRRNVGRARASAPESRCDLPLDLGAGIDGTCALLDDHAVNART